MACELICIITFVTEDFSKLCKAVLSKLYNVTIELNHIEVWQFVINK